MIERFSPEERTFTVETFFKDQNEYRRNRWVTRDFFLHFNKQPPSDSSIKRLVNKLHNQHSLLDQNKGNSGRPRTARTQANIQHVGQSLTNNPQQSCRRNNGGLSKSSFSRITNNNLHFHPFRLVVKQELSQNDKLNRLLFARGVRRELRNGTLQLQEILWSDEATFHLNGHVNTWNTHYYAARGQDHLSSYKELAKTK